MVESPLEFRYLAPLDAPRPLSENDFPAVPGVTSVKRPIHEELVITYFDTDDHGLAAAGMTISRTTAQGALHWRLHLPGDPAVTSASRTEQPVPRLLRDTVALVVRNRPLRPVVSLDIERERYRLCDEDGRVLVEMVDNTVRSPRGWREWCATATTPAAFSALTEGMRSAGASDLPDGEVIRRIIGTAPAVADIAPSLRPKDPAANVMQARLRELVAELRHQDPRVRRKLPDSVHDMRVATRRLRSTLATFRPLFHRDIAEPLRVELRWIARLLGESRDAEVMLDRLRGLVEVQPRDLQIGPVSARMSRELRQVHRDAHARAVEAMSSDRYYALVGALESFAADPPWTDTAARPAKGVLRKRVRHDWKRVKTAARAAREAAPNDRDRLLHETRKATKRARYAAEPLVPLYGEHAARFVDAMKDLQSPLGDQHDAVVAQGIILDIASRARESDEDGFTYGRLHALEGETAQELRRQFEGGWKRASRRRLRRWLD